MQLPKDPERAHVSQGLDSNVSLCPHARHLLLNLRPFNRQKGRIPHCPPPQPAAGRMSLCRKCSWAHTEEGQGSQLDKRGERTFILEVFQISTWSSPWVAPRRS